jgi:hypothetical protein
VTERVLARALRAEEAAEREMARIPSWIWNGSETPVPVEAIADDQYGMLVEERPRLAHAAGLDDDEHVSGLLLPVRREIWVDEVEARRAPGRRRFTIGHELGHWVLHCGDRAALGEVVHCRTEVLREEGAVEENEGHEEIPEVLDYPPPELEANQFSAALLMPAALVAEARRARGDDVRGLAGEFGVSTMAMERRLWFLSEVRRGG